MAEVLRIKPDPDCELCRGWGDVYDAVDYGDITVQIETTCDCVVAQIPEGFDGEIIIEGREDADYQE